ncbi:hypothetical protein APHAL10511_005868 [Amanita phalloides]|nr:hypothetical protein APHAL10511_005868 [Amanita phalloides]
MFTVKADYRGETRRFTYPLTFPTYPQLCGQLHRVFPLTNDFTITRLLFSPSSTNSIRLLIGQRVNTAEDYIRYIEPYRNRLWQDATLRLTVVDGAPTEILGTVKSTSIDLPQATDDACTESAQSSHVPHPNPPPSSSIPSIPHTQSAYLHVPSSVSGTKNMSCCSVAASKKEIEALLDTFMQDLNGLIMNTFPVQDASDSSRRGLQRSDDALICSRCKRDMKGIAFYCGQCGVDVCIACYSTVLCHRCPSKATSYHQLMRHARVPIKASKHSKYTSRMPQAHHHTPSASSQPTSFRGPAMPPFRSPVDHRTDSILSHAESSGLQGASQPTVSPTPLHCNGHSLTEYLGVAHTAVCDLCDSGIRGDRYKCLVCPDFDTCASCFSITDEQHPNHSFVKMSNPADYIYRLGTRPRHQAMCNICNAMIFGVRYKCLHPDCSDFDLCERCEAHPIPQHPPNHPLLKLRSADAMTTLIQTLAERGTVEVTPTTAVNSDSVLPHNVSVEVKPPGETQEAHLDWRPPILTPELRVAEAVSGSSSNLRTPEEAPTERVQITECPDEGEPPKSYPDTASNITNEDEKILTDSPLVNEPLLIRLKEGGGSTRTNNGPSMSVAAFLGQTVQEGRLESMVVKDITVPSGQVFPPGAEFIKTWQVINSGSLDWPESTELVFVGGDSMASNLDPILIGKLEAGAENEISTRELKAPEMIGGYANCWRLRADEYGIFGDSLWIRIDVTEPQAETSDSLSSSSIVKMPRSVSHDDNFGDSMSRVATSEGLTDEMTSNAGSSGTTEMMDDSDWQDCPRDPAGQEEYVILYDDSSSEEN